jgi:hypothetical protein
MIARRTANRPTLREALSTAVVASAVGAVLAWTTTPVAAAPVRPAAETADPFAAAATNGPAWIVTPRAARPGEVVHVRVRYTAPVGTTKPTTPLIVFAFLNDLHHPVQGQIYPAEGTFGVDLVVPPGTDWGVDPIVWGAADLKGAAYVPSRFLLVSSRNAPIPFVASRSAQPPLWTR